MKKKNATPEYLLQIHLQLFNSVIIRFKTFKFFRKFLYITLLKAWYKFRVRSAVKPQPCLRTVLFCDVTSRYGVPENLTTG